jgi:phytanoyl-CoA hydroxylase
MTTETRPDRAIPLRDELSEEQIRSYRRNGFLVIEDFLNAGTVDWLRTVLSEAVVGRGGARLPGEARRSTTTTTGAGSDDRRRLLDALGKHRPKALKVLSQHVNLWQDDERVRLFCLDPRLGRLACRLAGIGGVRIWHDQTMVKPAWGAPTGWHTDNPVFSFTHPGASTFWFALGDADLRNGCLHYLPGSHHDRVEAKGDLGRLDGLRLLKPEWEHADPVPCPVRAGALIVHSGDTAHAAGANMTPFARSAFTISWQPEGARFNGTANILPEEILAALRPGDPLDFDEWNPLVYRD